MKTLNPPARPLGKNLSAAPGSDGCLALRRTLAAALLVLGLVSPSLGQAQAQAQAQPDADALRFDIFEFVIEGNTVLPTEDVERAVYRFLGERRSVADIEAASAALQQVYRERGFGSVSVDFPEQRADSGLITLRVLEGRISRTRVTGSRYFSQGYILERVASAAEDSVPHFPTLQTELGTVNRTADRRVLPVLRPGREPGTTEVDLAVEDQLPLHGSVALNNHASPNTSATRLSASLRYDNLWQRDHSLGLQVVTSPEKPKEVQVLSATYSLPVGLVAQDSLSFSFTQSNSEVAAGVAGITVLGKGRIWGLRRTVTLALKEREFHILTLGADYKDFDETIEATGTPGDAIPIRYLPLSASYLGGFSDAVGAGRWQMGGGLSLGARGVVNREEEFRRKRYLASAGYSLLRFDLSREQPISWGNSTLRAKVDMQLSNQPLISNEQFVVGGADSVRGYLESAAAGDMGLRASLEWQTRNLAPQWVGAGKWLQSATFNVFAEGAGVWLHNALPGQQRRFGLLAVGVGLRLKAKPGFSVALDLGVPLRDLGTTRSGDPRLHANGSFEF